MPLPHHITNRRKNKRKNALINIPDWITAIATGIIAIMEILEFVLRHK
jgi:hypothetical protein